MKNPTLYKFTANYSFISLGKYENNKHLYQLYTYDENNLLRLSDSDDVPSAQKHMHLFAIF